MPLIGAICIREAPLHLKIFTEPHLPSLEVHKITKEYKIHVILVVQ